MSSIYFPIRSGGDGGGGDERVAKAAARLAAKHAFRLVMDTPDGESILTEFKANGCVTGHRVGDDLDCMRRLIRIAPKELQGAVSTGLLTDWEKAQLVTGHLRAYWSLDKHGKVLRDSEGQMLAAAPKKRLERKPKEGQTELPMDPQS